MSWHPVGSDSTVVGESTLATEDVDWSFVAIADFDRDGFNDLLMQNLISGERKIRLLNGTTTLSAVSFGIVDLDWVMEATADFKPDILWAHAVTGRRYLWFMAGVTTIGDASLGTVHADWHIAN